MTATGLGLGNVFNIVPTATTVTIPLTRAGSVAFICVDAGSGDQVLTMTELDSTAVNSEQALDVNFNAHNAPDIGGAWTFQAYVDDTVANTGGATNDTIYVDVQASQLSDGYDSVQCTVDAGTCIAVIYDLAVKRTPPNLASNIVA